jgi:hypothetical protein
VIKDMDMDMVMVDTAMVMGIFIPKIMNMKTTDICTTDHKRTTIMNTKEMATRSMTLFTKDTDIVMEDTAIATMDMNIWTPRKTTNSPQKPVKNTYIMPTVITKGTHTQTTTTERKPRAQNLSKTDSPCPRGLMLSERHF